MDNERIEKDSLRRARIVTTLISLIAISAVTLAIYAFQQKKKAESQTAFAEQKAIEALQQEKIALEQRNIADSNKEQAIQNSEYAFENERIALQQKALADSQSRRAEQSRQEAIEQQHFAEEQKENADSAKHAADVSEKEAQLQTRIRDTTTTNLKKEKATSDKLKGLADSRALAKEAVLLLNLDSSKSKALQAYQRNKNSIGQMQNNDIYNALNFNWTKTINDRNQIAIHYVPVHCITGVPNSNIVFTADESGMIYESVIKNNTLQKVSSYAAKEEIRGLSVSPDERKLVAITTAGNGIIFSVTSTGISFLTNFKFSGTGKGVSFIDNENFVLFSNQGIGKYHFGNVIEETFLNREGINAVRIGRSGKFYVASGNIINVYKQWDDLINNSQAGSLKVDSKVTSLAVDNNEHCLACGTYNGFVSIIDLKNNSQLWSKTVHKSIVNDLEFSLVDNDILQLASASADKTINLINVSAILQNNLDEDIITLSGHTKWIYDLYYTRDGRWLFSTGEDNKVIAWKTTMKDLAQTLNNQ